MLGRAFIVATRKEDERRSLFGRSLDDIAITALDPLEEVPMVSPTVQQIAQQNDQFRQGDPNVPGTIVLTAGMDHLLKRLDIPIGVLAQTVAGFSDFTDANDPHGEHDFGAFPFGDERCFWKIDGVDAPSHNGIVMCQTGFVRSQFN